jgi:hypothetical protein
MSGPIAISRETTEVPVEKTVAEIQMMLGKAGAQAIMVEFNSTTPVAVSFRIQTEYGLMTFQLPARIESVAKVREDARKQRVRNRTEFDAQSARTAWRIVKDWVQAQLALIQLGQATLVQVFLSYAQDASGKTLYESLAERRFAGLLTDEGGQ